MEDRVEIDWQVGARDVGRFLVQPRRPVELVGGLRPFRTAARLVEQPRRSLHTPRHRRPARRILQQSLERSRLRAFFGSRPARRVAGDRVELELVAAFVVDDEVWPGGHHLLPHDGGDAG